MVAIIFMIVIGVLGILMGFGLFELAADHDRTFMIWSHEWVQRFDSLYLAKADAAASLSDQPHSTLWDPWLLIGNSISRTKGTSPLLFCQLFRLEHL